MKKKTVLFAVLFVLLLISASAAHATYKSLDEALTWCLSHPANVGKEYDGYVGYYDKNHVWHDVGPQCVDFIRGYVDYITGQSNSAMKGDAKDYTGNYIPPGFLRIYKGTPRAGDIMVWTTGEHGHVAIVTGVATDFVTLSEQNYSPNVVTHGRAVYPATDNYWGIIRPDFDNPVISAALIHNKTSEGFDVTVFANDDTGVTWFQIGIWHSGIPIDQAVFQSVDAVNSTGNFHVSYDQFNCPSGVTYYTNAYAVDAAGRVSEAVRCVPCIDLGEDFFVHIKQVSSEGYLQNSEYKIITGTLPDIKTDDITKALWHFRKQKDGAYAGSYEITCENNHRCMDIDCYGTADGTGINLLERAGNAAQRFYILEDENRSSQYSFLSVYCNSALDVLGAYTSLGGTIQLWTKNGTAAQIFSLEQPEFLQPDFILPSSLSTVASEAFSGCGFTAVRLSNTVTAIETKAFANCPNLKQIEIPDSVTSIADNAFDSSNSSFIILCTKNSYAKTYAESHNLHYVPIP